MTGLCDLYGLPIIQSLLACRLEIAAQGMEPSILESPSRTDWGTLLILEVLFDTTEVYLSSFSEDGN